MLLAFGPNETYFFDDGNGNRKWRAWPAFEQHITSKNFGQITGLVLGEHETFWIKYTVNGVTANDWDDPKDHYGKLGSWLLKENVLHDYGQVVVSLGPNGSFFAWSSQGQRWRGLPVSGSCCLFAVNVDAGRLK